MVVVLVVTLVGALVSGSTFAASAADGEAGGAPIVADVPPPEEPETFSGLYIVELADPPAVAYEGGVGGLRPTKPAAGEKLDPEEPAVVAYVDHLERRQRATASEVGARRVHGYTYTYNGFSARLTAAQVAQLSADPQVLAITKDTLARPDTISTPSFLGLDAPGGIWEVLTRPAARPGKGTPPKAKDPKPTVVAPSGPGEGVVVGIIDSGIWPEHPSFSDRDATGKVVFDKLPKWRGTCQTGDSFTRSHCNRKLVTARWYGEGFGGASGIRAAFPYEFVSARDADGHGSHTAGTAVGNAGVDATIEGIDFGPMSGVAPRARLAVYKTCWGAGGEGGCFSSDSVAAIDQAVADGVDVINFSISGTRTNFRDPVEIAFLFAADAGVFVAASAGNSGPAASTVAHPGPWLTTVAASTHDRAGVGSVTLGNDVTYTGASVTRGVGPAPLAYAGTLGIADANATEVQLCFPGTLDPAETAGKIVVCDRDVIARTDKSLAVKQAGGVGMVLVNRSASSLNADVHYVPSVHLSHLDRPAILAYAATEGATATIADSTITTGTVTAPQMAAFSSRGPLLAGDGNLLKPDITAPGVDILAAYSPAIGGRDADFLSGTSMSSPHIAGVAALLTHLEPGWSPAAMKSAMMTTAYQTTRTGTTGQPIGGPFDLGAGHVDPNPAMDPGLVFDADFDDYLGFLCGTQLPASFCTDSGVPVLAPSDLNVPSVAIGALAGSRTVTRTVTNVSGKTATFTASTTGLAGIDVAVDPPAFTLAPSASQTLRITFTNSSAPLNAYRSGAIVWTSDQGHQVRIPTVARPVALAAPASIAGDGSPQSFDVTFGYTGSFSATARGLTAALVENGTVDQDPDQTFVPSDPTGTVAIPVTIPAGTTYTRFALFDEDVAPGADLDLYVYQGATLVGSSTSGTSAEEVNFSFTTPTGGAIGLTVYVHGWGVPAGSSPFALHSFYVPAVASGNMTVTAPTSAVLGDTGTVELAYSDLMPGTRYLGTVAYGGAAGMPAPTIVNLRTPPTP
jgi:subtilisin family serine protease